MSSRLAPALALAFAALFLAPAAAVAKGSPVVGKPAPPFTATTIDKLPFSLEAHRGKVVVLNYWATWCAPCKAEMPMMDVFYRRHQKAGFAMIGITTEGSVPIYKLKPLDAALAYPLAAKSKGGAYGKTDSVSTSYVIDRRGVLRHIQTGAFDEEEFDALLLPLLAERAPAAEPAR